ncbi:MAG: sugar transporter ATP-binding protein, partial [Marmoricola sp.]|nr:sugar transporter ATP-binding protein [Marmoricola sp.]
MNRASAGGNGNGDGVDEVVLSARHVVKTYGGTQALRGVNFDIHRGKVTTLFGENG